MARALVTIPSNIKRGTIIEIRAMIQHPMETGYRPGADGKILPRNLIRQFSCRFNDGVANHVIFRAELYAAVSANPFLTFQMRANTSGTLTLRWEGDNGFQHEEIAKLSVRA